MLILNKLEVLGVSKSKSEKGAFHEREISTATKLCQRRDLFISRLIIVDACIYFFHFQHRQPLRLSDNLVLITHKKIQIKNNPPKRRNSAERETSPTKKTNRHIWRELKRIQPISFVADKIRKAQRNCTQTNESLQHFALQSFHFSAAQDGGLVSRRNYFPRAKAGFEKGKRIYIFVAGNHKLRLC